MPRAYWLTGVYCIRCLVNNKRYVGSSATKLANRIRHHKICLKQGYHKNKHLQAAWNKYGSKNFRFSILERCMPEMCLDREQYWMDFYRLADRRFGYNSSPTAGNSLGCERGKEEKRRVAEWMRRPEQVARMTASRSTPEHYEKHKASLQGRCRKDTPEQREKYRQGTLKYLATLSAKEKRQLMEPARIANTGKKRTPEVVAKIKAANASKTEEEKHRIAMKRWETRRKNATPEEIRDSALKAWKTRRKNQAA